MAYDVSRSERIQGWMSRRELEWIAETASQHMIIVEVGCWKGRTTTAIAMHTPGVVYAVDHWEGTADDDGAMRNELALRGAIAAYSDFCANLLPEMRCGKVIPVRSECSQAITVIRDLLAHRKAGFVFIDGAHDYPSVRRDIIGFGGLLHSGGIIAGHDYAPRWPGVVRAVDELVPHRTLLPDTVIWYARTQP